METLFHTFGVSHDPVEKRSFPRNALIFLCPLRARGGEFLREIDRANETKGDNPIFATTRFLSTNRRISFRSSPFFFSFFFFFFDAVAYCSRVSTIKKGKKEKKRKEANKWEIDFQTAPAPPVHRSVFSRVRPVVIRLSSFCRFATQPPPLPL